MLKAKIERAWTEVMPDGDPDPSYLYQEGLGFEDRRQAFERGEFGFVGVRACAEIVFETEQGGWQSGPIVSTPGLWGIEDDSGEDYLREVASEEADQLPELLEALGIGIERATYAAALAKTKLEYH